MSALLRQVYCLIVFTECTVCILCPRWLVLALAMTRYYLQKGTHKGLYRSIARTLKFFQTFAVLEVCAMFLFLAHLSDAQSSQPCISGPLLVLLPPNSLFLGSEQGCISTDKGVRSVDVHSYSDLVLIPCDACC